MRLRRLIAVGIAALVAAPAVAAEISLPAGPNRDLVYGHCRVCHDLQYVVDSAGITRNDWDGVLDNMRLYGLRLEPDTRQKILGYLATYLGPNPPKAGQAKTQAPPAPIEGATIYRDQCAACHGADGRGVAGQFPPLAGNRDIFIDRMFPVYVVLNGLEGEIEAAGRRFNGAMPSFGHLSDAEIAAVIKHVRTSWNNQALRPAAMAVMDPASVKSARGRQMTAAEVKAYRAGHK